MVRFNAGPSAVAATAAAAAFASLCTSLGGAHAYAAKGMGGIASTAATGTHNNPTRSSALVPSSALARGGGGGGGQYPGDYDDLPYGPPPYLNDMDDFGPGPYDYGGPPPPMSSTYKPLFNDQRGGEGRGGPMALAPPRSTGRLSDRGKMNDYGNGPYNNNFNNGPYNNDGYNFPDVDDRNSYDRREDKRSSTFKPLFASSREQHPQNLRRDALAPMPRGRRSIRLSDEGKDEDRFDRRMMRENDRRDANGPYSNDLPYGAPTGGGGPTGRLSDAGKEYDRRDGGRGGPMALARRSGSSADGQYDRYGRWKTDSRDDDDRYGIGGLSSTGRLSDIGRRSSSTYKPLFDSSRDGPHPSNMRLDAMMGGGPSSGRLSDQGNDMDRYMAAGPPPPPMYYDERPGMRRQSDLGREKRYSGGVTYNAGANEYSRSSTFKPLFDSQRNKAYTPESEFGTRGAPDRRRLSDGRDDGGRYRISDDGRFGSGGNSNNYYDDRSRNSYFKYGGGAR